MRSNCHATAPGAAIDAPEWSFTTPFNARIVRFGLSVFAATMSPTPPGA